MATDQSPAQIDDLSAPRRGSPKGLAILLGILAIVGLFFAANARHEPNERIANPNVSGSPRPVDVLFGYEHWLAALQIGTVIAVAGLIVWFSVIWLRRGPTPYLLMALVTTIIVWQDPIMNWAPYAVYNPQLWHFPESWPLVSISPTVEPFVVIGYVAFQFGPYFPAVWVLRKIQARRDPESFVWRHPLISLALWIFLFGFIIDMLLEVSLIQTGMYIYSQVIPFGSILTGTTHQFPLLWESSLVTLVMIPAGVLVYRDDTGKTVAEKLAQRARITPTRPALGMFLVMLVIVNVAYLVYGAAFTGIKWSKAATSMACPWPYPEAKVFDPQGFYEKNGKDGPYSAGIMSTYMSGQPGGRPDVVKGSVSTLCADGASGE